jgi:membrane peptidoglycan carboxypeptidase
MSRALGVTSPLSNYHSLALGAQEMTLLEMVSAYGAMAADGNRVEAHGVARIRRASSNETDVELPSGTARTRHRRAPDALHEPDDGRVVSAGTGTSARINGLPSRRQNRHRQRLSRRLVHRLSRRAWSAACGSATTISPPRRASPAARCPREIWARFMPTALRNTPFASAGNAARRRLRPRRTRSGTPELTVVGAPSARFSARPGGRRRTPRTVRSISAQKARIRRVQRPADKPVMQPGNPKP